MAEQPYSPQILELAEKWMNATITEEEKRVFIEWYNQFDDSELTLPAAFEPFVAQIKRQTLLNLQKRMAEDARAAWPDMTGQSDGGLRLYEEGRVSADMQVPHGGRRDAGGQLQKTRTAGNEEGGRMDAGGQLQDTGMANNQEGIKRRTGIIPMSSWQRAAAVVLLIALGTGTWMMLSRRQQKTFSITAARVATRVEEDVMPGQNKAVLTLGDGSTIMLDSAKEGNLAKEGNTRVVKLRDGQLQYTSAAGTTATAASAAPTYNLLSTPRGGQYRLVLPDGSQVWLNAASSIRYPTAFSGSDRRVEVTGEAYFEVARQVDKPFRVTVKKGSKTADPLEIEVLGTHFNVHAYEEETGIRTTLLEGSVSVKKSGRRGILKPGQQAQLQENGEIRWVSGIDMDKIVAWKNGMFQFGGDDLQTVLREVARWYDVEVVYKDAVPSDLFTGQVSRNTSLSGVIKILLLSSEVHMRIEGKKIIVGN